MRTFRIVLIVLVLIGFPALSWFYLKSGLKWRVNAQEETSTKEKLNAFTLKDVKGVEHTSESLTRTYYVVATPEDSVSFARLRTVHDQFHVRGDFNTIYLIEDAQDAAAYSDSTWMRAHCVMGCEPLKTALFGQDFSAAIVDDSLHIRGRYHLTSLEEMRKMVEHLAVVLPIEKRERIELKRGNQ